MKKFEELKKAAAGDWKSLTEVEAVIERLNLKKQEITGKLHGIAADLDVALKARDLAIAQYARDEISEEQLDEFPSRISSLEVKGNSFARALEVVNSDLSIASGEEKAVRAVFKSREQGVWQIIAASEVEKAVVFLRRAWAATEKCGYFRLGKMEFLEKQVHGPLFTQVNDEALSLDVKNLVREYLK